MTCLQSTQLSILAFTDRHPNSRCCTIATQISQPALATDSIRSAAGHRSRFPDHDKSSTLIRDSGTRSPTSALLYSYSPKTPTRWSGSDPSNESSVYNPAEMFATAPAHELNGGTYSSTSRATPLILSTVRRLHHDGIAATRTNEICDESCTAIPYGWRTTPSNRRAQTYTAWRTASAVHRACTGLPRSPEQRRHELSQFYRYEPSLPQRKAFPTLS